MSKRSSWTCEWCGDLKYSKSCDCASTPKTKKVHKRSDRRCIAKRKSNVKLKSIRIPINSGWGQKQCTHNAMRGSKYCSTHIDKGEKWTPAGRSLRKIYEKYFQECLKLIAFDLPEMTIGEIYSYIQFNTNEEGRVCSKLSVNHWYRKYKVPKGFPKIKAGGGGRVPYRALLTGVNTMPRHCPDCGCPPKSKDGYWTPIGLAKHKAACKGPGSYSAPDSNPRRTTNAVMRRRHAEVIKNWLRGISNKENAIRTNYSLTQLKRIIKKAKEDYGK